MKFKLVISTDNVVESNPGIDFGIRPLVHARRPVVGEPKTIVLKIPGHNSWWARAKTAYFPTSFKVLTVIDYTINEGVEVIQVEELIDFPTKFGAEPKPRDNY